jgi:protein O-GlcNAc transferase
LHPEITFIVASIYPDKLLAFFENLQATAANPSRIEVLVKIDLEDAKMLAFQVETLKKNWPFQIQFYVSPRGRGRWDLYLAYDEMMKKFVSSSYFIFPVNDEFRFATNEWDDLLLSYKGKFGDDIFHLRLSYRRSLVFKSLIECLMFGESFGVFTRAWINAMGSLCAGKAAVDSGLECVNFFLRERFGHNRGVEVPGISILDEMKVISTTDGLDSLQAEYKMRKIYIDYGEHLSFEGCRQFFAQAANLAKIIEKKVTKESKSQLDFERKDWAEVLFNIKSVVTELKADWPLWPPVVANQFLLRRMWCQDWLKKVESKPDARDIEDIQEGLAYFSQMRMQFSCTSQVYTMDISPIVANLYEKNNLSSDEDFFKSVYEAYLKSKKAKGLLFIKAVLAAFAHSDYLALKGIDVQELSTSSNKGGENVTDALLILARVKPSEVRSLEALRAFVAEAGEAVQAFVLIEPGETELSREIASMGGGFLRPLVVDPAWTTLSDIPNLRTFKKVLSNQDGTATIGFSLLTEAGEALPSGPLETATLEAFLLEGRLPQLAQYIFRDKSLLESIPLKWDQIPEDKELQVWWRIQSKNPKNTPSILARIPDSHALRRTQSTASSRHKSLLSLYHQEFFQGGDWIARDHHFLHAPGFSVRSYLREDAKALHFLCERIGVLGDEAPISSQVLSHAMETRGMSERPSQEEYERLLRLMTPFDELMRRWPLVSVFMFCKNRAASIRRAVESVLRQTYPLIEFIVQDGASTDGTLQILQEYGERMELVSKPDRGPAEVFWTTLKRCQGELIASCLSDEELLPGAVAQAVEFFRQNPTTGAIYRDATLTDLEGVPTSEVKGSDFNLLDYMSNKMCPHFSTATFNALALEAIGLHNRKWMLDSGEFELWCRLGLHFPIQYLPGTVSKYALHEDQLSNDRSRLVLLVKRRLQVIDVLFNNEPKLQRMYRTQMVCRKGNIESFLAHCRALKHKAEAAKIARISVSRRRPIRMKRSLKELSHTVARASKEFVRGSISRSGRTLRSFFLVDPNDHDVLLGETRQLIALGEIDRGLAMLEEAVKVKPKLYQAYHEAAQQWERRGENERAAALWDKTWDAGNMHMQSLALYARLKDPKSTNESLLAIQQKWAARFARPIPDLPRPNFKPYDGRRPLRVGITCSFWHAATIKFQLLPFLRQIDRSRFTLFGYAPQDEKKWVKSALCQFRNVSGYSNADFVQQVRSDEIDVLIEINGFSPGHRFVAMASRCAPVQVSYLNYTSTSGVPNVDYVLADTISAAPDLDPFFTEKIYRMPGCFFCFNYEDDPLPPIPPSPFLEKGHITFGCFGSGGKINEVLTGWWAEILRRVPNSKIYIRNMELKPADNRRFMEKRFAKLGIEPGRLILKPGTTRENVLKSYAEVDISLDTYPYCGGNTIAESLWQGVPVITLKGRRFSEAYGASLLSASGLAEWIAESPEQYIELAVKLSADAKRLQSYRRDLRKMVVDFGFSDPKKFAREFEKTLLDLIRESPPERFNHLPQ